MTVTFIPHFLVLFRAGEVELCLIGDKLNYFPQVQFVEARMVIERSWCFYLYL